MIMKHTYVGGQSRHSGLEPFDKIYPATGEVIARIEPTSAALLDEIVADAAEAQKAWAATSGTERGRILLRAAKILQDRNEQVARVEVQDVGKAIAEAESGDVPSGPDALEYFGGIARDMPGTYHTYPGAVGFTQRVPLGVCAGIGAWNYPTQIACWKAAPALAAGNAFILKPSEETPLTAYEVADALHEAGLPSGLFSVVQGDHTIGRAICEHPGIAKVSLTGGVDTGKLIIKQAADTLKKVTLELGGKSPLIVFEDADLDDAVGVALSANFYTSGEVCSNGTRVFVHRSIADTFLAEVARRTATIRVGDPMDPEVHMGALISEAHLNKVMDYIEIGKNEGATLLAGGNRVSPQGFENGYFVEPTVFSGCTDDMRIVREEIFGPVMSVLVFDDEDEAVRRANDTFFGLGAGLMTTNLARAHRVADQLVSGSVCVNTYNICPPDMPFGGSKQSGFGRENSRFALEGYTEVRSTYMDLSKFEGSY